MPRCSFVRHRLKTGVAGDVLRSIAKLLPTPLRQVARSLRFHAYCRRRFSAFQEKFAQSLYGDGPIEVLLGPFQGMEYFNRIVWGPITPKWIGSYECELHDVVREIIATPYAQVIDVECAEGYYAVGFAATMPNTSIIAYDTDFLARRLVRRLAGLNGVTDRIAVRTECTHDELTGHVALGRTLLFVDIEGGELRLIDPRRCPSLRDCDVLVECHGAEGRSMAEVGQVLAERFVDSHEIKRFVSRERTAGEWSSAAHQLRPVDVETLSRALDECRQESQMWLWMRRR